MTKLLSSEQYMSLMTIWRSDERNSKRYFYFKSRFWLPISRTFGTDSHTYRTARRIFVGTCIAHAALSETERATSVALDKRMLRGLAQPPTSPVRRVRTARKPPNIKLAHARFKSKFCVA